MSRLASPLVGGENPREAAQPRSEAELPPLSLYVHLPWCLRKCPYCDFNSYEARAAVPDLDYVDALLRDLDSELPWVARRPLGSVFIGGGTPSLFSVEAVARLMRGIRRRADLPRGAEVTLEANPGALEAGRFTGYLEAGVNRLSIGVQSFRDRKLASLGRVHDGAEAARAVELAQRAGFANLNLDLMYALPGDDAAGALADLESALALSPSHLSWYQLTLEPDTAFFRRPPALPDEDSVAEIERLGRALLERHGFGRYEVSAYARPGRRCAHNLNYWRFGDYLGIGAGAHGKLTGGDGGIVRRSKARNPRTYMERAGAARAATTERVDSPAQITLEFMMGALRLPDGVSTACFERRTGLPRTRLEAPREAAVRRGWMAPEPDRLKPTPSGLEHLNALLALFVTA